MDELVIGGQFRTLLASDSKLWRRVIFDVRNSVAFQCMDDSFERFSGSIDAGKGTVTLTKRGDKSWKAPLTFQRPAKDQLVLDGRMGSQTIHMQLRMVDRDQFVLTNRRFRWVQEFPSNR